MNYWLVKSEPDTYHIDELKKEKTAGWDGVRNYQARNFMRDMKKGDLLLYYHSNAKPSGVVGIAVVNKEHYPDPSALDPQGEYYDPKSSMENNRWSQVEFKFKKKAKRIISLEEIKGMKSLAKMALVNSSRLSVQPVSAAEWKIITAIKGAW